jgi:hypothetical protein
MAIRCKMTLTDVFANTYGGAKAIFHCSYDPKLIEEDGLSECHTIGNGRIRDRQPEGVGAACDRSGLLLRHHSRSIRIERRARLCRSRAIRFAHGAE